MAQNSGTLQLQPRQLCFLLDDLVRKLDHSLLATAGKRRCYFLKVSNSHEFDMFTFGRYELWSGVVVRSMKLLYTGLG